MRELTIEDALEEAKALSQNDDAMRLRNAGRSLCDAFKLFLAELGKETYGSKFVSSQSIKNRFWLFLPSLSELSKYRRLARELEKLRNTTEHSDSFSPGKRELQAWIAQSESLFRMMPLLKEKLRSQGTMEQSRQQESLLDLYFSFSQKLDDLVALLEHGDSPSEDIDSLLKLLAKSFKQGIERSNLQWVEMATRDLFKKLCKFSERGAPGGLHPVFSELFANAYGRRQALDSMINALDLVMLESFVQGYDVQRAEKAAKVLLQLGIDFLGKDLSVTRQCATAIDDLAAEMFEPEILSKEIILAARAFEADPSTPELQDLRSELEDSISGNDREAWSDNVNTYLRDSINYARTEQDKFGIDIRGFQEAFLDPALQENIDANIADYVDSLEGLEDEDKEYLRLARDELIDMISDYRAARPLIADEIRRRISEKKDDKVEDTFSRMIDSSEILSGIYKASSAKSEE